MSGDPIANFGFGSNSDWINRCTIVLLRALTGAGYVEGEDQNVELGGSSLFARFETSFMMESRRAREAAAGWGLEALRHGRRVSRLYPWVPGTDAEAAEDDIIGRLIFGEPSTVHTRSTLPAVSTAIISSA